jgi:hypothetical protein
MTAIGRGPFYRTLPEGRTMRRQGTVTRLGHRNEARHSHMTPHRRVRRAYGKQRSLQNRLGRLNAAPRRRREARGRCYDLGCGVDQPETPHIHLAETRRVNGPMAEVIMAYHNHGVRHTDVTVELDALHIHYGRPLDDQVIDQARPTRVPPSPPPARRRRCSRLPQVHRKKRQGREHRPAWPPPALAPRPKSC